MTWHDDTELFAVVANDVAGDVASDMANDVDGDMAEKADGASVTGVATCVGEFIFEH